MKYETFGGQYVSEPMSFPYTSWAEMRSVWRSFPGLSGYGWHILNKVNGAIEPEVNRECPAGIRAFRKGMGVNVSPCGDLSFDYEVPGRFLGLPKFVWPTSLEDIKESVPYLLD